MTLEASFSRAIPAKLAADANSSPLKLIIRRSDAGSCPAAGAQPAGGQSLRRLPERVGKRLRRLLLQLAVAGGDAGEDPRRPGEAGAEAADGHDDQRSEHAGDETGAQRRVVEI